MPIGEPERLSLADLPTPLIRLPRLERELDRGQIWMKRDDLTGLELSGNKVRKLEFVVAEALAAGCDTIVTEGTSQSNHCRATAAVCAKVGLRSLLLFRPEPSGVPQGNHLLDVLCGAQTRSFPRERFEAERDQIVEQTLAELTAAGHKPRWTPMGSSEPLGCWAYARAASELAEQLRTVGVRACDVVVAVSSGGTYAGLLLGKLLHRLDDWRLWAVPVSDDVPYHTRNVARLCRQTIERFDLGIELDDAAMQFIDGYVGQGYGIPYSAALEAIQLLARTEGIILDPVYTAKTFCALLDGVRNGRFGHERPVVFIHTGGIFSNFAWPHLLLDPHGP
jgi:D-cysteine desulfhydrase